MSEKVADINRDRKIDLYNEQHGVCAYCGKPLTYSRSTVDHIVPQALAKYTDLDPAILTDDANVVISCFDCNRRKGSELPLVTYLPKFLSSDKRERVVSFINSDVIQDKIAEYQDLVTKLIEDNGGKCYCCHRKLSSSDDASIRRLDWNKPRELGNIVAVCHKCSGQACIASPRMQVIRRGYSDFNCRRI